MADSSLVCSAVEGIAQELVRARKQKGLTVDELCDTSNFRKEYIERIESGDFGFLPPVYAYAFLKEYCQVLETGCTGLLEDCRRMLDLPSENLSSAQTASPDSDSGTVGFRDIVNRVSALSRKQSSPARSLFFGTGFLLLLLIMIFFSTI